MYADKGDCDISIFVVLRLNEFCN